jgi:hypothetical protein
MCSPRQQVLLGSPASTDGLSTAKERGLSNLLLTVRGHANLVAESMGPRISGCNWSEVSPMRPRTVRSAAYELSTLSDAKV